MPALGTQIILIGILCLRVHRAHVPLPERKQFPMFSIIESSRIVVKKKVHSYEETQYYRIDGDRSSNIVKLNVLPLRRLHQPQHKVSGQA